MTKAPSRQPYCTTEKLTPFIVSEKNWNTKEYVHEMYMCIVCTAVGKEACLWTRQC